MNNKEIYDKSIFQSHTDFDKKSIDEKELENSPFIQFNKWFNDAINDKENNANAMSLSTVNSNGLPSSRIVLLKDFDENGFVFYTNYNSNKGKDIETNPYGCILFFWQISERQIRIQGSIKKIDEKQSDEYFITRPIASQINTWVSKQSQKTTSEELISRSNFFTHKYHNNPPRPSYWGGFVLVPTYFEFWQGRTSRLHDRFAYSRNIENNNIWNIDRLFP